MMRDTQSRPSSAHPSTEPSVFTDHAPEAGDVTLAEFPYPRFLALFEAAPDSIVITDDGGRILLANAHTERLFGYGREEFLGQPFEMLLPERLRATHVGRRGSHHERARTRPGGMELELPGRRKDGTEFPMEISMTPLPAEEGTLVTKIIRDVSERKRVEEERAKSEERFRALLEAAPDSIVITDGDGRILLVNAQTEALFGYARDELLGQTVEMLMPARFRDAHAGHRAGYHANPRTRPMGAELELFGRHKNGLEFPVEISLSPLPGERGTLVTSIIRGVRERVRAEEVTRSVEPRAR